MSRSVRSAIKRILPIRSRTAHFVRVVAGGLALSRKPWLTRGTAALVAVAVLAGLTPSPAVAQIATSQTEPTSTNQGNEPLSRPDAVSAQITARMTGKRVEILSERTETVTTWANPDGTFTSELAAGPVRVFDPADKSESPEGSWHDVDTDLIATAGGLEPVAAPAEVTFSDGGREPAAELASDSKSVGLG